MKRILIMALCLVLICAAPVTALAQEGFYESAGALYQGWMRQHTLPGYVSGVWSTDGGTRNLTIGIVDNENKESAKQEILDLIIDDSSVTFVYQKYSRNYLYEIMEEINPLFQQGLGLVTAGTNDYDNRVEIEIHEDYKDNPSTLEMINKLTNQYGDAVSISFIEDAMVPVADIDEENSTLGVVLSYANPMEHPLMLMVMVLLCSAVIIRYCYVQKQKKHLLMMENGGEVVTQNIKKVSTKQIEEEIREADPVIPADLDARIMNTIRSLDQ